MSDRWPRWIDVEERLPEDDGVVIINTEYGVTVGRWDSECDFWIDEEQRGNAVVDPRVDVTHWMPLPEAPR